MKRDIIKDIKEKKISKDNMREHLVLKCKITPISHITLLSNQKRKCVCGRNVGSHYYVLFAECKQTKRQITFNTGPGCGKSIIELSKIENLPLLDLLKGEKKLSGNRNSYGNESIEYSKIDFSDFNKELMKAIGIYCASRDWYPNSINNISYFTIIKPNIDNKNGAKWFNDRLITENTSMAEIISKLEKENNLKKFEFPLLRKYLLKESNECRI
ncbi:MAG: hypothetical protein H6587_09860 [Flavobacteriales bacterium]|nr:hypothetical protein [Flavobacteriales bacterium]